MRFHPLAQITTWQIEKWKAEEGKRLNPVTINRRLTVIKHMFKKAVEWDLLKSNPATSVKRFTVTSERTRFLSNFRGCVRLMIYAAQKDRIATTRGELGVVGRSFNDGDIGEVAFGNFRSEIF